MDGREQENSSFESDQQKKFSSYEVSSLKEDLKAEQGDIEQKADAISAFLAGLGYGVDRDTLLGIVPNIAQESLEEFRQQLEEIARDH